MSDTPSDENGIGTEPDAVAEDTRVARTRADVSRAALEVLTGEGWEAVTHAHVARVAGYSKTTLYTHWPSRFDLLGMALDAIGDMPHHEMTGDARTDLVGELSTRSDDFRRLFTHLEDGAATRRVLDLILPSATASGQTSTTEGDDARAHR